ncbi:MAG: helix-turn-helix domain-containing protein [Chloroflexia bacterium]|nr:helix-turn-helix domain-containing protein [Chloroflexia bacterium]
MNAQNQQTRQIVERLELSEEELERMIGVLHVALDTLDDEHRVNVAAIARKLGKSRRTIYNWADRILDTTAQVLREIRVGRPPKEDEGP